MITLQVSMPYLALPYKTKQFFFVLIKLSIVVGAAYFIYEKLTNNTELPFSDFIQFTSKKAVFVPKNIVFLLFLSILNWFLEVLKWQKLVSVVQKISLTTATDQCLGALTASLFTPNRIGEYGAKVIYFPSRFRNKIVGINLIGNVLQMSITIILGVWGLITFVNSYDVAIDYFKVAQLGLIMLILIGIVFLGTTQKRFQIKGFSITGFKKFIFNIPQLTLVSAFLLSLFRYMVFSFQFYSILKLFQVNLLYSEAMVVITSMYIIASIIPSIFIFDVVIKGGVALYLFSFLNINPLIILCTVMLMWILNFAIPSCFGGYYVLNFKLPKPESDDSI
ncbi:MAG: hypothetical protein ACON5F_02515 [Jejuia sp.]